MNGFFANLFEFFGLYTMEVLRDDLIYSFSNDLANSLSTQPYVWIGLLMIFITSTIVLLFYNRFDHPKFANIKSWLGALLISVTSSFLMGSVFSYVQLSAYYNQLGITFPYPIHFHIGLGLIVGLYAMILFSSLSLILKIFSVNQRNNPV